MIKQLTKEQIEKANQNNPCALKKCPKCGCDVIKEKIERSKLFITEAWISGCPFCNYSFCD